MLHHALPSSFPLPAPLWATALCNTSTKHQQDTALVTLDFPAHYSWLVSTRLLHCHLPHNTSSNVAKKSNSVRAFPGPTPFGSRSFFCRSANGKWSGAVSVLRMLPPSYDCVCHLSDSRCRRRERKMSGNIFIFSPVKGVFQINRCCELYKEIKSPVTITILNIFL